MASFYSLNSDQQSKTWFSEVFFLLPSVGALPFSFRITVYCYKSTFKLFKNIFVFLNFRIAWLSLYSFQILCHTYTHILAARKGPFVLLCKK